MVEDHETKRRGGTHDVGKIEGVNGQSILSLRCPEDKGTRIFKLETGQLGVMDYAAKFNELS